MFAGLMRKSPTRNLLLIRILAAVSAVVSTYLLVTSLRGGIVAGCGPASGCEDVLASRWAYWLGLPVSGPALLIYATMFVATFWATPDRSPPTRQRAMTLLSIAALVVVAAALWFVTLQIFVVRHFCPYCLVAHGAATGAAILVLRSRPRPSRVAAIGAALGAAALLAGHWINRPATHEVAVQARSAPEPAAAKVGQPGQPRELEILGGLFKINVDEVPLIGRRDAPAVMVSLLDYTCPHCRQMHGLLLEAERAHRGKLAIATLPMPLDAACNKLIARTSPQHENACQYARLGLAVWRADPSKMDRFNDWLFEPAVPPGMASALGFAQEIVGDEALGRAMNDPWVEKQLAQDIAIYETTYKRFGKGAMPLLIIGDNIVFGGLEHGMEDLDTLLRDILK
jgi:uncharacterized membrane protein/protein-disulfide isomerase